MQDFCWPIENTVNFALKLITNINIMLHSNYSSRVTELLVWSVGSLEALSEVCAGFLIRPEEELLERQAGRRERSESGPIWQDCRGVPKVRALHGPHTHHDHGFESVDKFIRLFQAC